MSDPTLTHRRDFVRGLALGASTGLLGLPATASARPQDDTPAADPEAPADPIEAEIEARMNLLLARYGDQLDEQARQVIRGEVGGIVRRAARLREFPLENGDGPATVWVPYRAPLA